MSEASEDLALPAKSRILQTFVWWGGQTCPPPYKRQSEKSRHFADAYPPKFSTYHSKLATLLFQGVLSIGIDEFSLTGPCQKFKKPWNGLLISASSSWRNERTVRAVKLFENACGSKRIQLCT